MRFERTTEDKNQTAGKDGETDHDFGIEGAGITESSSGNRDSKYGTSPSEKTGLPEKALIPKGAQRPEKGELSKETEMPEEGAISKETEIPEKTEMQKKSTVRDRSRP